MPDRFILPLMQLHTQPLPFYTSSLLSVPHGCFCRLGGISPSPFDSLNLSYHVGDRDSHVTANRKRAMAALQIEHIVSVRQTHSDQILILEQTLENFEPQGYDAIISSLPGVGLLIQQADCQAVLLFDPEKQVIAAVHCGWRGSVLNIIEKTVCCLQEYFHVRPADLRVVISPSLGPCCAEFIHYKKELPEWMYGFQTQPHFFDFWAMSRQQLQNAGVFPEHIEVAAVCTCCHESFFSYRREKKNSGGTGGRHGSIIALPGKTGG